MPHFKFPSHYVYWGQVKDHENIKSKLLPIIHNLISKNKYTNPFEECKMTTNFSKKIDFINRETMDKIIWPHIEEMVSETKCFAHLKPLDAIVKDYWFNVYQKGDFQEMHSHQGLPEERSGKRYDNIFSVIYILHGEESSPVKFRLDNIEIPFYPMKHIIYFDTSKVDDIKEGTILIFSSQLNHTVIPVKTNGRVSIAFNIACCFE